MANLYCKMTMINNETGEKLMDDNVNFNDLMNGEIKIMSEETIFDNYRNLNSLTQEEQNSCLLKLKEIYTKRIIDQTNLMCTYILEKRTRKEIKLLNKQITKTLDNIDYLNWIYKLDIKY